MFYLLIDVDTCIDEGAYLRGDLFVIGTQEVIRNHGENMLNGMPVELCVRQHIEVSRQSLGNIISTRPGRHHRG